MNIYTMVWWVDNGSYRLVPEDIIDDYESLVWTERYTAWGDFELDIASTQANKEKLIPGTLLYIPKSIRIMIVETVDENLDEEGKKFLKVTGRSMESLLEQRSTHPFVAGGTTQPYKKVFTNQTLTYIINYIFDHSCGLGTLAPTVDRFPPYISRNATGLGQGNIPMYPDPITLSFEPADVYSVLKEIADAYGVGFRIGRSPSMRVLYFNHYTGSDRTSTQHTLPPVIFSSDLQTLTDSSELTSNSTHKNVAMVYGKNGTAIAYENPLKPIPSMFDRRVLVVMAEDIDLPAGADLQAALIARGKQELAKHRSFIGFDGKVPEYAVYKYGVDYNLGDLVEVRNEDGLTSKMTVTEHIFIVDKEGERSYPTFMVYSVAEPGTWDSWDGSVVWDNAMGEWDNM